MSQETEPHIRLPIAKTIVLVGIMGVGKTSIGRRLGRTLGIPFYDSDQEVERAARISVSDIYAIYGEQAFVDVERRVIQRLMSQKPHVLSTGVGSFLVPENRELIKKNGFSIWLKASYNTLLPRVERRDTRPQLDPEHKAESLKEYLDRYSHCYEQADIQIDCDTKSPEATIDEIISVLGKHFR